MVESENILATIKLALRCSVKFLRTPFLTKHLSWLLLVGAIIKNPELLKFVPDHLT